MKKAICITPADDKMEVAIRCLNALNKYRAAGFDTKKAFIELVITEKPEYHTYDMVKKLETFWENRTREVDVIEDLEILLEKLQLS